MTEHLVQEIHILFKSRFKVLDCHSKHDNNEIVETRVPVLSIMNTQ